MKRRKIHHNVFATQEEVIETLDKTFSELKDTLVRKGRDYSGKEDTFKNFKLSADLLDIPVESVIISRMGDKLSRLASITKSEEINVSDETIVDTINDLVGYCVLLKTYIKKKEQLKVAPAKPKSKDEDTNLFGNKKYVIIDDDGEIN